MLDLYAYLTLSSVLCLLAAAFFKYNQYKKNPMKYENGRSAAIILLLLGVLMFIKVLLDLFS
ncbi:MAG: hypothetical protein A4E26_02163 [Methanobacterium sp. PtaU1.Bin097]|nr:MAG: hypothetical protein A4E26_02163 [Methanobacterium sp. PtaU1.Bin097]